MRGLVFFLFLVPMLLLAQQKNLHHQITPASLAVVDVLELIHQDGSVLISYDPDIIPDDEVLLDAGHWSMLDLLNAITSQTELEYKIVGKNYILSLREAIPYTVSGHVEDSQTGENLLGALVRISGTAQGVTTNTYGFFSLEIPPVNDSLEVQFLGYETQRIRVRPGDQSLVIGLKQAVSLLETVVVEGDQDESLMSPQFGRLQFRPGQFDAPLGALAERDILRQMQQQAGVAMTSESSSGFSVRGARPNQNLILIDEAIVYNPTHFVGFFSVFNADALNRVDLYKGGIPARFGGRLASVTNIMMREGNNQQFRANGNLNALAGSLSVEGPLKKKRGAFIVSGRKSFTDLYLLGVSEVKLSFLDVNVKYNYKFGEKDRLYISGYFGEDVFRLPEDAFQFKWGNTAFTMRWNHVFNPKLFLNTSFILSAYDYELRTGGFDQNFDWITEFGSYIFKADLNYFLDNRTQYNFGFSATFHQIAPALLSFVDERNPANNASDELNKSYGLENALYGEIEREIGPRITVLMGLRLTAFHNVGPGTQFVFDDDFDVIETISRDAADFYHTYVNVEPRLSASYEINTDAYLKASYNRTVQYISQASNSISGSPLDVWFLSSPNVKPQLADQVSLGYFRELREGAYALSLEGFYRKTHNEIDFKDNAELLLNNELEAELRIGSARSYGAELTLTKNMGRLTGDFNFTWSRSFLDVPLVNGGLSYPSTYDRPINLSISPSYALNDRLKMRMSWVYFSGLPFTSPTGRFTFGNVIVPSFSNRNGDRLPEYHRLDFALELGSNLKKQRRVRSSWSLAIYNVYNRQNANFISFRSVEGSNSAEAIKFTIFGIVPTIAYRFKF